MSVAAPPRARHPRATLRRAGGRVAVAALVALAAAACQDSAQPRILWGVGDEIGGAVASPLYRSGQADMVTSWYNGPADLRWMRGYRRTTTMSDLYGAGKAQELVVWLGDHPQYAVGQQFQRDVAELTSIFAGNGPHFGPLYVVLFSELETYSSAPGYRDALKAAYLTAVATIHRVYPQAEVALGFGGYTWDGTRERDLTFWADAIAASDFTAVQAMQACTTRRDGRTVLIDQVRNAVAQLGAYGKPVMISHFSVWGSASCRAQAYRQVATDLLAPDSLADLRAQGLFAWDFMSNTALDGRGQAYDSVLGAVRGHASDQVTLPAA